ncbi:MAG TPA: thioesterase family protein [Candidatus Dormibacteraeota bacterium]|nr:thioesterase family protein [Candidatus Dormibacteraeota bacterium]
MSEPLFRREGETFMPTRAAAGPWDPNSLHGGAAASLMTWAMEAIEPDPELPFARITCELLRPVPMSPLSVSARLVRPGKRVQLAEAEVRAGEHVVARATGLRIRKGDADVPTGAVPVPAPPPGPEAGHAPVGLESWGRGLIAALDLRVVQGDIVEPGPATCWFRFRGALLEGEAPTALQQVVAAADFGNGLSGVLDFRSHLYINPDLTVYLHRYPRGDWVGLESASWIHSHGVGLAESRLWDQEGPIGRSLQSLLIGKRT